MKSLVDKLYETNNLLPKEYKELIDNRSPGLAEYLFEKARPSGLKTTAMMCSYAD